MLSPSWFWLILIDADSYWLILTNTDWCWLVMIDADLFWEMLIYADWYWLMLIGADWCWFILRDARAWHKLKCTHFGRPFLVMSFHLIALVSRVVLWGCSLNVFVYVFVFVFLLVISESCLLVTLIKCLKGHKYLVLLSGSVFQKWWVVSQSWQGHLFSSGTAI